MAFPQIVSGASTTVASATTAATITMPPTFSAGDLLLAVVGNPDVRDWPTPTGWNEIGQRDVTSTLTSWIYARVADGTASDAMEIDRTGLASGLAARVIAISGHYGTAVDDETVDKANTFRNATTWDGASLTTAWGSADNLWLVMVYHENEYTVTFPTEFTDNRATAYVASRGGVAVATLESATDTVNPTAFVSPATGSAQIWTVAVRPASGASAVAGISRHYARMMNG